MSNRARLTAVVLASAVGSIGFAVYLSLDRDSYFFYTPEARASWTFSPGHIALVCGVIFSEAVIWGAALLSSRPRHLWLRSVLALIVLVPWGLFTIQTVMHAPRYVHFHHLWLWLVILSLVVAAIASGTMHVVSSVRQRRVAVQNQLDSMSKHRETSERLTSWQAMRLAGQLAVVVIGLIGLLFAASYARVGSWAVAAGLFVIFGTAEALALVALWSNDAARRTHARFHWRALVAFSRVFAIWLFLAGLGFAYAAVKFSEPGNVVAAGFCFVFGTLFAIVKPYRPDLPPFEGPRTWWTGEPKQKTSQG